MAGNMDCLSLFSNVFEMFKFIPDWGFRTKETNERSTLLQNLRVVVAGGDSQLKSQNGHTTEDLVM